ncbi:MAG: hypothetical protein GY855_07965, partial [candidate division Zixibacteria bacterium]|nr:hypothetical protein [candidate division Zixibacteria bacterium]
MTKLAKIIIWASVMTLLLSFQAMAAQSLRVASSVDEIETPIMQCSQNGTRSTAMKIDIKGYSDSQVRIAGQTFNKVELAEREKLTVGTTGEVGKPELPLYTTNLAIPNYKSVNVRVNYSSYEIFENYDIAPVQQFQVEGEEQSFSTIIGEGLIDPQAYNTDAFYPEEIVSVGDPMILRDFRMAMVTVAPVQYNPATRQLKVYTDIDFDVVYEGEDFSNPAPVKRDFISDAFKPLYQSMFANFDQVCSDLPSKRGGYMIITHDVFYDSLAEFAEWKHQKGYDVKIVKLSDIRSNPTSYHIDTFIDTCYTNWEIPPEYILLVGDVSMPSSRYFPDYSYSGYTSDHEYCCVDGDDYLPDVYVSRWAIDTDRELHWVMRKTMTYEMGPQEMTDGWLQRGLSVAGNMYAFTPRLTTLWVRNKLLDNNYTQVDTCFDWSEGGHNDCNEQVIRNSLNDGVNIMAYRGWAYASGWENPYFKVNNLNSLTNDYRGGIMTSIVCGTGDYDDYSDPCFGEAWIRGGSTSAPRGGIAFFGSTDHSTHTQWNNPIMVGFYWGLFDEDLTHFMQSVVRGKLRQYETFPRHTSPGGYIEQYFHTYNPLGDPEVNVWRTLPGTMNITYDNDITTACNYVAVEVKDSERNPLEGAYVTAIKTVGGEDEIFSVSKSDASGNVLLPFDTNPTTGDMSLTVTHRD